MWRDCAQKISPNQSRLYFFLISKILNRCLSGDPLAPVLKVFNSAPDLLTWIKCPPSPPLPPVCAFVHPPTRKDALRKDELSLRKQSVIQSLLRAMLSETVSSTSHHIPTCAPEFCTKVTVTHTECQRLDLSILRHTKTSATRCGSTGEKINSNETRLVPSHE